MPRYDPFANQFVWTFTTAASLASITTDPIYGRIQRVSLVEGTVSDADWAFALRDQDNFVVYSNASVTANVTSTPLINGVVAYAVASTMTMNVSNANGAKTGTVRVYYSPV